MARLLTLMAISICGVLFAPPVGLAQSDQDNRCFPWQEFRDGACVAKPAEAATRKPIPSAHDDATR